MFERFTDRARRVVVLAQEEARRLNHNYIGTEHILLGLIQEGEGHAAKALEELSINIDSVRSEVVEIIGEGQQSPSGHIPFTPRAKKVLELSLREALQLGHNYIGTEHILLGLIREGEGVAAQVLKKLGAELSQVRQTVIKLISSSGEDKKPQSASTGGRERPGSGTGSAILDQFGRNLTRMAKEGKLDPVIGRSTEIERVMQILSRRTKNNPVLIGEPGVGKTAIVEGLAQKIVSGDLENFDVEGADKNLGAFFSPILFRNEDPFNKVACHDIEAFGPVSTIMPYKEIDEAIELAKMGKGSLVSSIVTPNNKEARDYVVGAASMHGRILVLNKDCAKESTGHGSPMPLLTHGGPGRAGGGEEMGGKRGVLHYLQRTAIQGHPSTITAITEQFQIGAAMPEANPHVFRKHFEELIVGETVYTHKHTVTDADIVNFANVSGDNFYAHMDATSLDGTIFEQRVAHGYFILSKAAGLFVDPKKGLVLLNYGLDDARFIKPVYPGATIGVRFTVKEKMDQEKRSEDDIAKGIVRFLVDVYDETGETVALATILTMVKKLDQTK